ncbi:MAG TPA: hypothetical protein VIL42_09555 [Sphingomicrobium sp.]
MLKIAALIIASAAGSLATAATTSSSEAMLASHSPWWEKVTVTMSGDGNPQSCRYETSVKPSATEHCDVASTQAAAIGKSSSGDGTVTRITFERRFTPGETPVKPELSTGDTLLGGQVMAINIGNDGKVKGCKVVAMSGAMRPEYSCADASAERFEASLGTGKPTERQGYMTIIVYGHSEYMV